MVQDTLEIHIKSSLQVGDYQGLWGSLSPLQKNIYFIQAFVDNGFRNSDLKSINFVRKFIQAVTLADIVTTDCNRISH